MKLSRKQWLNLLSYLATAILLTVTLYCFVGKEQLELLRRMSWSDVALAMLLSLSAYAGNGWELYLLRGKFGFSMEKKDILLLPLGMNLWGMLLPFQGAMAYLTVFLKRKYNVKVSVSCSISLFLYLITIFLSGVAGCVLTLTGNIGSFWFNAASVLFLSSPVVAWVICRLGDHVPTPRNRILAAGWEFLRRTLSGIALLLGDWRLSLSLVGIYLLRLGSMILFYFWIAHSLGYQETGFLPLLLLNLWNMLSLLIKFTPNNLGISQLVSGILFSLIALPAETGVMISLVATLIFSLVALTLGTVANFYAIATFPSPNHH